MITSQELHKTLKDYFGFEQFRGLQEQIVTDVLNNKDNLVIIPTGGGKSICYQLPAVVLPGLTLVISPLIALMKDQVDSLNANGIPAAYINSSQSDDKNRTIIDQISKGKLKLLYVAPESLSIIENIIQTTAISLVAVDEAHCISSWGHDFRPAYTQLSFLKNRLPDTPIIALTATADKATRTDIAEQLNLSNFNIHIDSFDRPNISLDVRPAKDRIKQITRFIRSKPNTSGIIYCLSRKQTEQLAGKLKQEGFSTAAYHAGLSFDDRSRIQEDFVYDRTQIICATIAFGMGIDKSNVRWVIHYNLPKNMEGYYQEIGRAGRDGEVSETILFYSYADVIQLQKFADQSGNKEVQSSKLQRIQQYAEAVTCRRKILLSYFGEYLEKNCNNCDVCENPPTFFDGTIIAQKVLSGIFRLKENEPIGVVVDFLRGAQNATILDKQYNTLKTYGVAQDISWFDLQQYIIQLINQGYCEIAFHLNNSLRLTSLSKKVLFENQKVELTKVEKRVQPKTTSKLGEIPVLENNLFEKLRQLRLKIAKENDLPAYLIFNDATLKQMERERPMTDEEFLGIDGVGRKKFEDYGYEFIKEIIAFHKEKRTKKKTVSKKKDTLLETFKLYEEGLSLDEISQIRKLNINTIKSHYIKLFESGKPIDLKEFVTRKEIELIEEAKQKLNSPHELKPYFEYFKEQMPYETIKFGLAIINKKQTL